MVYDNSRISDEITNEQQVECIMSLCPRFIEAVVILGEYWFFVTSFCIFIHADNIDDCADASRVGVQEEAVASIRKKPRVGRDYFELTTRFNNVELLATSGFFGQVGSSSVIAFVGSSIQNLLNAITERYDIVSSKNIFIRINAAPITRVPRLINQYIKTNAANKWMLISKKYEEKGFLPSHPLAFQSKNPFQAAASLLLKIFVNKSLYKQELQEALKKIQKTSAASTASNKLVVKYVTILADKEEFVLEDYNLIELKKDMLYIYENTLAGPIRSKNIALAKKATEEYRPARVDLFEEDEV